MTCDYCDFSDISGKPFDEENSEAILMENEVNVLIYRYDEKLKKPVMVVDTWNWEHTFQINFCPMCGRKL